MTAKEIAKILGISPATLSLAVNHKPGLSAQTRQRVLDQLRENGYDYLIAAKDAPGEDEPDAKSQAGNTASGSFGFVTYHVGGELFGDDSFFPLILNSIEERAKKYGFSLSYINMSRANAAAEIERLCQSGCSGLVLFATEMKAEDLKPFQSLNIPLVLLDNLFQDIPVNAVKVNNEQGTYLAVKHLWEMGHRRIGYLSSGMDIDSFHERRRRALDAMHQLGAQEAEKYCFTLGYPMEETERHMRRILADRPELPTAFLADNDLVAAGAMRALKSAGLRIPEDISMIGFDDRPVCQMTDPPLTTIRLPRRYFGGEAVELLMRLLTGEEDLLVNVSINTELVKRQSVAAAGK